MIAGVKDIDTQAMVDELKKRGIRWEGFTDEELRILKQKLAGSNNYDEPVASRLWREINVAQDLR